MVPFIYVDFWDVPRLLLFRYRESLFVLASCFSEEKDDWPDSYTIQSLPNWVEDKIRESDWRVLEQEIEGRKFLGEIAVNSVIFDETRKRTLDPSFLDEFLE